MVIRNKTTNVYTEWLPLIETLPNEIAGVIFKNILKYQNGEDVNNDFPIWVFIKSKIDEYNNKGKQISEKRKENGKLGGLAKASKCKQELANDSKSSNKIKENKIKEKYIYEGKIIKLNEEDYSEWEKKYPDLDLRYCLERIDIWFQEHQDKKPRWFFMTQSMLLKEQKEAEGRKTFMGRG